jgi:hypothetical protein
MYQPKEGEQFFFMHIPKTGGTTFRHMLYNHFPDGTYYPSTQDLWKNNGSYLDPKQIIKSSKKILCFF